MKRFLFVAVCVFQISCLAEIRTVSREGEWNYTLTANQNSAAVTDVFNLSVPEGYFAEVTVEGRYEHANSDTEYAYLCQGAAIRGYYSPVAQSYSMTFFGGGGSFNLNVTVSPEYYFTGTGLSPYKNYYCKLSYTVTVRFVPHLPDLSVAALTTAPSTEAAEDASKTLNVTVKNVGEVTAAATTATVYDGENRIASIDIPSLSAGSTVSKSLDITGLKVGEHTLRVVVAVASKETLTANNEGSVALRVYARTPYAVRFDANGGSGKMPAQTFVCGTSQRLAPNAFERDNYRFAGWATSSTGNKVYADEEQVLNLTYVSGEVVTLFAVWERIQTFIVHFNGNGGSGTMVDQLITNNVPCKLHPNSFANSVGEFAGWGLAPNDIPKWADETNAEYLTNGVAQVQAEMTLYAIWGKRLEYHGKTFGDFKQNLVFLTGLDHPAEDVASITRHERYIMGPGVEMSDVDDSWVALKVDGDGELESEVDEVRSVGYVMKVDNLEGHLSRTYMLESGVKLYTTWGVFIEDGSWDAHLIVWVRQKASGTYRKLCNDVWRPSKILLTADAYVTNVLCAAFSDSLKMASDCDWLKVEQKDSRYPEVVTVAASENNAPTERIGRVYCTSDYYARWRGYYFDVVQRANAYGIAYALNGGTHGSVHPTSAKCGVAFQVSAPTRACYTFAGWTVTSGLDASTAKWGKGSNPTVSITDSSTLCSNGATGDVYFMNLTPTAGGVVNLSAQWRVNSYALMVKPNNTKYGSVSDSGTYDYGTKVTLKATAKPGYVFTGWYTDKACKKKLNPEGYDNRKAPIKYTMPAKKTTIYAKFISKSSDKKALKFSDETQKLAKTAASYAAGKTMAALTLKASSASLSTLSMKDLPKGMTFDPATGAITGKPTVPGKYTATVTVKTAAGNSISQKVKIYVTVQSGYYGTFDGYALVKTTPAYMTFTSDVYGKVSGKVTYKGKGYSFKASYSSVSATKSKFTPSIKIGSKTYKPAVTIEKTTGGITVSEARGEQKGKFIFVAQKKPGLVAKKKALANLIGQTVKVKYVKGDAAALPKSKDSLTLKFAATDAVKVSGKLNGKSVSFSTTLVYCGVKGDATCGPEDVVYVAESALVEPKSGYSRLATFTLTVGADGKVSKKVSFGKIKAED